MKCRLAFTFHTPPTHFSSGHPAVNPLYGRGVRIFLKTLDKTKETNKKTGHEYIGYKTNCQTCVATYIARRKGYDVRALPNVNNNNIANLSFNTTLAYIDQNGNHPKQKRISSINDIAFDMKPNSIYAVRFDYVGRSSGHIVIVEKEKSGRVFLYDPQSNRTTDQANFKNYAKGKTNFNAMDLTNVSLDEKYCDKIMKRR